MSKTEIKKLNKKKGKVRKEKIGRKRRRKR